MRARRAKGASLIALRRAQTAFVACAVVDQVPTAPTEGLTFYVDERWSLSLRGGWPADLSPYELYLTRTGREDELIGYWEQARLSLPMFPPVLTGLGFMQMEFGDVSNPKPRPQAFLLDRMSLDAARAQPRNAPSDAERRAQFTRLARSDDAAERALALRIVTVTGDAFLTGADVDMLLARPDVTDGLVELGNGLSACTELGRLCAFRDRVAAACRRSAAAPAACDRVEKACAACEAAPRGPQDDAH